MKPNYIKLTFSVLFMGILILPIVVIFMYPPKKKLPELSLDSTETSIDKLSLYYADNIFAKPEFLDTYINLKTKILKDQPLPSKAIVGKDGWYFLGNHYNDLFDDSFGNLPLSDSELTQIKNNIIAVKDKLEAQGIAFHIVVPPNKHRLYPEMLPFRLSQKPTRLQQLNTYLKQEIDFEILDLRDTLQQSKGEHLLYYKTNTHWNDLGAFIGYQKTLKALNMNVRSDSLSNYTFEYKPIKRGDVTEMINIKFKEKALFLDRKHPSEIELLVGKAHLLHYKNPKGSKKLLMYRDSFANAWIKFFNESFAETVYIRNYKVRNNHLGKQKPDVVVFEIIERNLSDILLNVIE